MLSMHDAWVEAAENGHMAGVVMVDMSAAFDVVDTSILLEKCKILNFQADTLKWLKSYLCNQKQSVYLGGHLSTALSRKAGVPQGSILGPILYTIYTCDFWKLSMRKAVFIGLKAKLFSTEQCAQNVVGCVVSQMIRNT